MTKKEQLLLLSFLILLGIAGRLLPHPWNTTPITGIILLASAYLGLRRSSIALLIIMIVTDALIGFYQWQIMISVYASFLISAVIGSLIKKVTVKDVLIGSLSSSVAFFFITNWAVWQFGTMYDHSISGLAESYVMALPFFRNSLIGDLFYTGLLFGAFHFVPHLFSRHLFVNKKGESMTLPESNRA